MLVNGFHSHDYKDNYKAFVASVAGTCWAHSASGLLQEFIEIALLDTTELFNISVLE